MRVATALPLVVLLSIPCREAAAVDANANFTGTVLNTCALTVGSAGLITPNAGFTSMSSENPGGQHGTIAALVTGGTFTVTTITPSAFTLGSSTNVAFSSKYGLTGATSASNVNAGTTTTLNSGLTTVNVDMAATKSSGTYSAGAYNATVVVRCE